MKAHEKKDGQRVLAPFRGILLQQKVKRKAY